MRRLTISLLVAVSMGSNNLSFVVGRALSFVGASGKHDLREVTRLRTQHQNQWPYQWLHQQGITYAPFDY